MDTILITGMGGLLTIRILDKNLDVTKSVKELVLQPQSEIGEVRKYLHRIGFEICAENILIDEGKFYVMMKAVSSSEKSRLGQNLHDECSLENNLPDGKLRYEKEIFYTYGKLLLESKSPVLLQYLERELSMRENVLEELKDKESEKSKTRTKQLYEEIAEIREGLQWLK